jgi:hypothetical protein
MRLTSLIKPIPFLILISTSSVFADVNVCHNKFWLQNPIVKKKSDNESGIGGTGETLPNPQKVKWLFCMLVDRIAGLAERGWYPKIKRMSSLLKQVAMKVVLVAQALLVLFSGFGSICVNGIEVHYEPTTPIIENHGLVISSEQLALGQTVSIFSLFSVSAIRCKRN